MRPLSLSLSLSLSRVLLKYAKYQQVVDFMFFSVIQFSFEHGHPHSRVRSLSIACVHARTRIAYVIE